MVSLRQFNRLGVYGWWLNKLMGKRDLSPTHVKRLLDVVQKLDRFVDPIVVMSAKPGL